MQQPQSISKQYLYITIAISVTVLVLAITFIILVAATGYVGFDGGTPITANCTTADTYYGNKYGAVTQMVEISFVTSIIAASLALPIVVIMLVWVVKVCGGEGPATSVSKLTKVVLYILSSLTVMACIPPLAYNLTFLAQLGSCTSTYNTTQVIILLVIAAILLLMAILLFLLLFCTHCRSDPDQIYGAVDNQTVEDIEKVQRENQYAEKKIAEKYENLEEKRRPATYERKAPNQLERSPIKRAVRNEQVEETKQNLYRSPSRNPTVNYYMKEKQPAIEPYATPQKNPYSQQMQFKKSAPILQPNPYRKEPGSSYIPQESYNKFSPTEELVFSKQPNKRINQDQDTFNKEQNRYMSKYGGSILPSSGLEEKESREKKVGSDYFRSGEPPRRLDNSPPVKPDREGVLLKYIRGKYAN